MNQRWVKTLVTCCSECPHLGQTGLLHNASLYCELEGKTIDVPFTREIPDWCPLDKANPSER